MSNGARIASGEAVDMNKALKTQNQVEANAVGLPAVCQEDAGVLNLTTDTRQANWRRANPERYRAHLAVQRALKSGELVKGVCEVCADPNVDGHHDDYSKPLAVRWLCRQHHVRLHNGGEDMFMFMEMPE